MTNCPSCGCRISGASRFCPMCGVTVRQEAVDARFGALAEIPETDPPKPNETLLRSYAGLNCCGAGVIRALKALAVLLSVVIGICGVVYGVMLLMDGSKLQGIISLVLGPGVGLLLYVLMSLGIFIYENISFIARQTETQNRISISQLELINDMLRLQKEELALTKQNSELLKVIDGSCFDAVKQAEAHTELLDKLNEAQRAGEQKLIAIKNSSEQLARTLNDYENTARSRQSNTRQIAHAIALAISQLPDRIRDALQGRQTAAEDADTAELYSDNDNDAACEAAAEEPADTENAADGSDE